jgi:hypothetical protein
MDPPRPRPVSTPGCRVALDTDGHRRRRRPRLTAAVYAAALVLTAHGPRLAASARTHPLQPCCAAGVGFGSTASSALLAAGSRPRRVLRTCTRRCPSSGCLWPCSARRLRFQIRPGWRRRRPRHAGAVLIGGLGVYPSLLQRSRVAQFRRRAALHQHRSADAAGARARPWSRRSAAADNRTAAALERNSLTIKNTSLWDNRPLLRPTASFRNPHLLQAPRRGRDRYTVNGGIAVVMLSARARLPVLHGRGFINDTDLARGYGPVASRSTGSAPRVGFF